MKVNFTVLDNMVKQTRPKIDTALHNLAEAIRDEASRNAPRATGALADSLEVIKEKDLFIIQDNVPYGIFIELGTYRTSSRPFLSSAMENKQERLVKIIEEILQ